MAIKKVLEIEVDDKDLKKLNEVLNQTGIEMSKVESTSKTTFDETSKGAKKATGEVKETSEATSMLTGKLDAMTGGAISGFKGLVRGARAGTAAMVTLSGAIAATGIGALVIAVGALVAAFRNSEEGQNKWNRIASVTGALVGNLTDLLADLGEKIIWAFENPKQALIDFKDLIVTNIQNRLTGILELAPAIGLAVSQAFSGDFVGAAKTAGNALLKITTGVDNVTEKVEGAVEATEAYIEEQKKEAKAADDVAKMRNKADKIERDLLVERSELENKISDLKLKSRQEDEYSAEQRKKFLLEVQELEDGLLGKELEALKLRRDAQELENTFSRSNKESLDAEAEAIAAVNDIETKRNTQKRATQRELNRVNKEIERDEKAARKEKETQQKKDEKKEEDRLKKKVEREKAALKAIADGEEEFRRSKLTEEEREVEDVNKKYDDLIKLAIDNGQSTAILEEAQQQALLEVKEKYDKKRKDADDKAQTEKDKQRQEEIKKEEEKEKEKYEFARNTLSGIGDLVTTFSGDSEASAKRNFKVQKALGIANATISGIEAVQNAYKTAQGSPLAGIIPGYPVIQAGIASAFTAAKISQIARQQFSSPTTPSVNGGGGTQTQRPIGPQFNLVGQGIDSQIAGGIVSGKQDQVLRAYVVEKDITSAQQFQRRVNNDTSFG